MKAGKTKLRLSYHW